MEPTNRPSLTTDLEKRYATQKAGGPFDAKNIDTTAGDHVPLDPNHLTTENRFVAPGFTVKMRQGESQFLDVKDGNTNRSLFIKGFNNKKYKP